MPNEIAPAQMLRMALPYPEPAPADHVRCPNLPIRHYIRGRYRLSGGRLTMAHRGSQVTGRGGRAVSELSMETPFEDADEQSQEVPDEDGEERTELPFETDEA